VPDGAAVRGFDFSGPGKEPSAELLPKDKAEATYKSIVAKMKDPALLEFAGYNLIRSSVFPVDAHGEQKIRLTYEHLLPADGGQGVGYEWDPVGWSLVVCCPTERQPGPPIVAGSEHLCYTPPAAW